MQAKLNIKDDKAFLTITACASLPKDETANENSIALLEQKKIKEVSAVAPENNTCLTAFAAVLYAWAQKLQNIGVRLDTSTLSPDLQHILALSLKAANTPPENKTAVSPLLERMGEGSYEAYISFKKALSFIREASVSLVRFISGRAVFRSRDFWFVFAACSYQAVGIIALVSFLVGLILAFVGALQLKNFGAGIYVASMVALGMTRIMAAIMVGIIMAGRTGSSYAATLGTMQVNEEIDALKTLGVKIAEYLVAPRIVALVITIPFLTLLADVLGILGGAVVGVSFLDLTSSAYFDYSIKALKLDNILVGLLHSLVYGVIISLCGCYAGLNAGRDADSVGKSVTSAVVTAMVWMIVATGILTVILQELGI